MSTVDLHGSDLTPSDIPDAPTPTRLILLRAGTYTGVLPGGLVVQDCQRFQDSNPANPAHYYVTTGTHLLFNVSTGDVIDLGSATSNDYIVIFPPK